MEPTFSLLSDYLILAVVLGACVALFVYAAYKNSSNINDYVWGGGKVSLISVILSLVATHVSSILFMFAGEVYQYGVNVCLEELSLVFCGVMIWFQLKHLHKLKLISLNDYIGKRFSRTVQMLVSPLMYSSQVINTMAGTFTISVFLGQVLGVDDFACFLVIISSCFFLTAVGGFRAVVWTDSCFALAMLISSCAIAAIGVNHAGGFHQVWTVGLEGDRLTFDWNPDPTIRASAWSIGLGCLGTWFAFGSLFNPTIYQRYAALTEKQANKAILFHMAGVIAFKAFAYLCGYIIYSLYQGCDPVLSGEILSYDQIVGYFVQQVGKSTPFFRTLFIACNVSASISTITTIMGTSSAMFYKDVFQAKFNPNNEYIRGKRLVQLSGLLMTVSIVALVLALRGSGSLMDIIFISHFPLSLYGSVLFMGIFMPRIRSRDALWGACVSFTLLAWMVVGSRVAFKRGLILNRPRPMRVDECPGNVTLGSLISHGSDDVDPPFYLYRISTYYQNLIGFLVCVSVASFSSVFGRSSLPTREVERNKDLLEEIPFKKSPNEEC